MVGTLIKDQMLQLEGPSSIGILEQAFHGSLGLHNNAFVDRVKKGKQESANWHDALGPLFVGNDNIEFLVVRAGSQKQFYLCVSLFSPKWAKKNKLTEWIAFELNEPEANDPARNKFSAMFGEIKKPRFHTKYPDKIQSRIVIECFRVKGKPSLNRNDPAGEPKYFLTPSK